tara:strand:+ start:255 stop:749 length:495 start_codon:yes stop_codon:yes gene_type:complete
MNQTEDLTELVRLMNNQLHEKDKQIENQQRQIEQLMKKLNIPKIQNNYIQNNHITLLPFQDTDISHLTEEDYAKCVNAEVEVILVFYTKELYPIHANRKDTIGNYYSHTADPVPPTTPDTLMRALGKNEGYSSRYPIAVARNQVQVQPCAWIREIVHDSYYTTF